MTLYQTGHVMIERAKRIRLSLAQRLCEDAEILSFRGGFPTIVAELDEAVEVIERSKRAIDTLSEAIEQEGYAIFIDPDGNYSIKPRRMVMLDAQLDD